MISKNCNWAYGGSKDQKSTLFSTVPDLVNDEWLNVKVAGVRKKVYHRLNIDYLSVGFRLS